VDVDDHGERRWIWGGMRSEEEEREFWRGRKRILKIFGGPLAWGVRISVLSRESRVKIGELLWVVYIWK